MQTAEMKTQHVAVNQETRNMSEELKDYTAVNIDEFLVSKNSVIREYEQTDALAVDQLFEGVPGGNIIFGGMQIRKKKYSDTTTAGVWIGVDTDGVGKINIGDSTDFLLWNGSSLVMSGDITASSGTIGGWTIGATTLTGGGVTLDSSGIITGGTIRTSSSGQRVQMLSSSNTLQIYDSGGTVRAESYSNGWQFNNSVGTAAGRVFIENTFGNLELQAVTADLFLTAADDITFAPGNGAIVMYLDGTTKDLVLSSGDFVLGSTTIVGGGSWTLTLPSTNGTSGQFLQTDGSGNTTWASVSGGANTSLSNLTTTSINEDLVPAGATQDLGTSLSPWDVAYVDDIFLTNASGGIYYNSNLALDFYATRIELGSTYSDFSPATSLSANLGSTNRWSQLRVDTIDLTGNIGMNDNQITDIDEIRFTTGAAKTAGVEGAITFFDSGTIQYRGQIVSTEYSFDLTAV